jgi:hypothetical protein
MPEQSIEGYEVTAAPKTSDHPDADRSQDRLFPIRLTSMDIGQMCLDDRKPNAGDGITDGDAVVGVRPRVHDHSVGRLSRLV